MAHSLKVCWIMWHPILNLVVSDAENTLPHCSNEAKTRTAIFFDYLASFNKPSTFY